MVLALYIFVDDDYSSPVYVDPATEDLDPDLVTAITETANEAYEGDRPASGNHTSFDEVRIGWRLQSRLGINFVCAVTDDVSAADLDGYLKALQKQYLDEVDNPREPEREGVADVVVDVIAPWEE